MLAVLALGYIITLSWAPYSGQFLIKVLPMLMILVIALSQLTGRLRWQMSLAVIASSFGDVFLALPIANSFILGLGSFLIAQFIYSVTYFAKCDIANVAMWRKFMALVTVIFAVIMAVYLLPDTGEMKIPVAVYLTVVCAMGCSALLSALPVKVALGAISFVISDAILALGFFKTPLPLSDVWVMSSYYLAQYLMVQGVVEYQRSDKE